MTSKHRGRKVHEYNVETSKDIIFRPTQTLNLL